MKKWPLYILLFLVVVQKNNFENWIASGQIVYKKIHQSFQHFSKEHSFQMVLSKEAFQVANKEEHELYLENKWYDIQSFQSTHPDSVLVTCQKDDWETYLAELLNILDDPLSTDSNGTPFHSKLAKTWSFEPIPFITLEIEHSLTTQNHGLSITTLLPENPWIKVLSPPPSLI